MSAEQFTTAGSALTCQGCGGTIPINTGIYLVPGATSEAGDEDWACSPECGRAAGIRRTLETLKGLAVALDNFSNMIRQKAEDGNFQS